MAQHVAETHKNKIRTAGNVVTGDIVSGTIGKSVEKSSGVIGKNGDEDATKEDSQDKDS